MRMPERALQDRIERCSHRTTAILDALLAFARANHRAERESAALEPAVSSVHDTIVEDTGPGISKDVQDKIFEPFFRVEDNRAPGTGIGLATVRRILDARGGRVAVESDKGRGARFTFWLPALEKDCASHRLRRPTHRPSSAPSCRAGRNGPGGGSSESDPPPPRLPPRHPRG
jgi:K+-sensing histidine kinase KdpD